MLARDPSNLELLSNDHHRVKYVDRSEESGSILKRNRSAIGVGLRRAGLGVLLTVASLLLFSVFLTLPLRWVDPATTAFIAADKSAATVARAWIPYEDVPYYVPLAIVASEDQKFPLHHGFDLESIQDAMTENRRRTRGASTITQQLAKNLYLWPGRSYVRKGIEAWLTVLLEAFLSKRRILELYMNVVEFGPGVYGVGAAATNLFGKTPGELSRYEAALLAAVLPNPKRMSAARPSVYVRGRARKIERMMWQLGRDYLRPLE